MTEITGAPKRSNPPPIIVRTPIAVLVAGDLLLPPDQPYPWPFKREEHSTLAWWRALPADSFGSADHEHLRKALRKISILHVDEGFAAALRGETYAAIGAALAAMPISEITLQVEIVMTSLLSAAPNRNAVACLVLAQVVGLTDLDHPLSVAIAGSWLSYGMRHSSDPDKFGEAAAIFWREFENPQDAGKMDAVQVNEAPTLLTEPRA